MICYYLKKAGYPLRACPPVPLVYAAGNWRALGWTDCATAAPLLPLPLLPPPRSSALAPRRCPPSAAPPGQKKENFSTSILSLFKSAMTR